MAEGFPQSARTTPSAPLMGRRARRERQPRRDRARAAARRSSPPSPSMASRMRASTRGWPRSPIGSSRSPSHTGTGPPSRTRGSRSKRSGGWMRWLQRLVAQARRIQAAELHGLGVGGEREQEVGGRHPLVAEPLGLLRSGLEGALGGVGERQLASPGVARAEAGADVVGAQRHEQRELRITPRSRWPRADGAAAQRPRLLGASAIACRPRRCSARTRGPSRSRGEEAAGPSRPRKRSGAAALAARRTATGRECPAPRDDDEPALRACAPPARAPTAAASRGRGRRRAAASGTGGRSPPRGGAGARRRRPAQAGLGEAVADHGRAVVGRRVGARRAARRSAASRPAAAPPAPPHGARMSAHSVAACRPWLRTRRARAGRGARRARAARAAADARRAPRAARRARRGSSARRRSARRACRRAGSGPSWRARTTAARSAAGSPGQCWARQTARSTRAVSRMPSTSRPSRPAARHDRVEHQPGHAVGVGDRVALGHEGAVGDAVERELVGPERDAQGLEVGDRVGRRVEARARGPSARAHASTAPRGGTVRSEVPIARCSAGQRSAPAPVPRWSSMTSR